MPIWMTFRDVYFENTGKIIFRDMDMSRISLLSIDLSKVEFEKVRWWNYKGAFMTIDALALLVGTNLKFAKSYIGFSLRESLRPGTSP